MAALAGKAAGGELCIWAHHEDSEGRSYFYNTATKESTWELPDGENDWLECSDPGTGKAFFHNPKRDISLWEHPSLQKDAEWMECVDTGTGRAFYYNTKERRSVWTKPGGDDAEDKGAAAGEWEEEAKDRCDSEASQDASFQVSAVPDGEYHDYVMKEGGGTTMFGRKSWKRRFLVLKHGEIGWFKSFKDYASGGVPLKGRWTTLSMYRLEESLSDGAGVRLLPLSADSGERVWNLRCDDQEKKKKLMAAMTPFVAAQGFVKHLDRELSGRRFLSDYAGSDD